MKLLVMIQEFGGLGIKEATSIPSGTTVVFEDSAGVVQNCFVSTIGNPAASLAVFRRQHTSGATGSFTDTMSGSGFQWSSRIIALKQK